MAVSSNGYTAAQSTSGIPSGVVRIRPKGAKNPRVIFTVRKDISGAFQYLIDQFHARVESLDEHYQDDWSYHYREVRGGGPLSNHASATAVDLNATQHPLGVGGNMGFTTKQIAEVRQILRELSGVIRWGGDYSGRKDGHHFEIAASPAAVKAAVARLQSPPAPPPAKPEEEKPTVNFTDIKWFWTSQAVIKAGSTETDPKKKFWQPATYVNLIFEKVHATLESVRDLRTETGEMLALLREIRDEVKAGPEPEEPPAAEDTTPVTPGVGG
jgi:hypothetical protein